jgi:hypothetical protein
MAERMPLAGKKGYTTDLSLHREELLVCCLASLTAFATVSSYVPRLILIKT